MYRFPRTSALLAVSGSALVLAACASSWGGRGLTQSANTAPSQRQAYRGPDRQYKNRVRQPAYQPPQDRYTAPEHYSPPQRYSAPPQRSYIGRAEPFEGADIRYHDSGRAIRRQRGAAQESRKTVASVPPLSPPPTYRKTPKRAQVPVYEKTGWARWMGKSWIGHTTASGDVFDPDRLTGAHESFDLPAFVYVTNTDNNRTVLIRVNDRVPAVDGRVIVVSALAAELLGFIGQGRAKVDIQYAGPAAPEPNALHEESFLKKQPWFRRDMLHAKTGQNRTVLQPQSGQRKKYPTPSYQRWDGSRRPN